MDAYTFTDRARRALHEARVEAVRLKQAYVTTEHLLWGLIKEGNGVACAALSRLGVDLDDLQGRLGKTLRGEKGTARLGPDLPYTTRAKRILELAMAEAGELKHDYVGTEHVLLGILREGKSLAAQMLEQAGAELKAARSQVGRLVGDRRGRGEPEAAAAPAVKAEPAAAEDSITLRGMRFHTLVGLLPHEQQVPQPLELDVTASLSLRRVGESDSPKELLDYRSLYNMVAETVGQSPHRLLEALCEKIAHRVLQLDGVRRVRVAARKPHAPIPGPLDYVEVVIERAREA